MNARAIPTFWRDLLWTADVRYGPIRGWPGHLAALGVAWAAVLVLFGSDVGDMVRIWWTSSTFEHCLFIVPIIGWLVHQRLDGLNKLTPQGWLWGVAWVAAGNFGWLLGDAAGVAMVRHFGVVMMLQGAVAALLGPALVRALAFPLAYAFFLVPFGTDLESPLQLLTAWMALAMLLAAKVPTIIDGIFITTPGGYFKVAEACSGTKFVIAMAAYAVLVANVCFRSWGRRLIFVPAALLICLIANGIRAFGIIYLGTVTDLDVAVGVDHVVYGWVFFGVVMTLVMAAAWPFFDRSPNDAWFDPRAVQGEIDRRPKPHLLAGLLAVALLAAPAWSAVSGARGGELPVPVLPNVAGWSGSADPMAYPWEPSFPDADHLVRARYRNDETGAVVDLAVATYARQREGQEMIGFGKGAVGPDSEWAWSSPAYAPDGARGEEITAPGPVVRHVLSFYRVGGITTGSASKVKLATARARLLAQDQRAAAVLVSAEQGEGQNADAAIAAFLHDLGDPTLLADAALGNR